LYNIYYIPPKKFERLSHFLDAPDSEFIWILGSPCNIE